MSRKHRGVIAATLALSALVAAPVATQAAETPPHIYKNGTLVGTTPSQINAWGRIKLESGLGTIECINQFYGTGWNPSGGGAGRGEVEAWTSHTCIAPLLEETFHAKAFATAEPPFQFVEHEGEYCTTVGKRLAECPSSSERTRNTVFTEVARRLSSLPWKVELVRAYDPETEEQVILQRTGMSEFGEAGTGTEHTTKCFPKNASGEPASWTKVPAGCVVVNIVVPQFLAEYVFYGTEEPEAVNGIGNGLSPGRLAFKGAQSAKLVSEENRFGEGTVTGSVKLLGAEGQELISAK